MELHASVCAHAVKFAERYRRCMSLFRIQTIRTGRDEATEIMHAQATAMIALPSVVFLMRCLRLHHFYFHSWLFAGAHFNRTSAHAENIYPERDREGGGAGLGTSIDNNTHSHTRIVRSSKPTYNILHKIRIVSCGVFFLGFSCMIWQRTLRVGGARRQFADRACPTVSHARISCGVINAPQCARMRVVVVVVVVVAACADAMRCLGSDGGKSIK